MQTVQKKTADGLTPTSHQLTAAKIVRKTDVARTEMRAVQHELSRAETTWFHIFRNMIDSGDAAKLGGTTFLVYAVIKAHANFGTGRAFPGIETIAEKAGISADQVTRCIKKLEEQGYLLKEKSGRRNIYTLIEKVRMLDDDGCISAIAQWPYRPAGISEATTEIKHYINTGEHNGSIIHVERLYLQINTGGKNTQVNLGAISDPELRAQLQNIYEKFQANNAG
jgi:DNA-binding MarR family transcriptional regulator